jgi:oligoendopeptidase F
MFADFELEAHTLVERDEPITAEVLSKIYGGLFEAYYGDSVETEPLTPLTWARIPHFFHTPYYVYQYATCFASAAKLAKEIAVGPEPARAAARERFLELLAAGGNDHPMSQLKQAGVDLAEPSTVQAVVERLDVLVSRLEALV